ncbi:MAG: recombinase-like helix-turn-helix domain-containing protein [bacterium]|jgi:hypothetical protein|nr:hypothetical protein [Verrucomicrobiota bacterium]
MTVAQPYLDPHQARKRTPDDYENLLADSLERAFAAGIHELEAVVEFLNDRRVPAPGGQAWSLDLYESEMRRLGQ